MAAVEEAAPGMDDLQAALEETRRRIAEMEQRDELKSTALENERRSREQAENRSSDTDRQSPCYFSTLPLAGSSIDREPPHCLGLAKRSPTSRETPAHHRSSDPRKASSTTQSVNPRSASGRRLGSYARSSKRKQVESLTLALAASESV